MRRYRDSKSILGGSRPIPLETLQVQNRSAEIMLSATTATTVHHWEGLFQGWLVNRARSVILEGSGS